MKSLFLMFALLAVREAAGQHQPLTQVAQLGGGVDGVRVWKGYAYVAEKNSLTIFKLDYPPRPARVGQAVLPFQPIGFDVTDDYAYACGTDQVQVIDVTPPGRPMLRGKYQAAGLRDVACKGSTLYVLAGSSLQVLDASNPNSPSLIRSITPFAAMKGEGRLHVSGNLLFVFTHTRSNPGGSLAIYDVNLPAVPSLRSTLELPYFTSQDRAEMALTRGAQLCLAGDDEVLFINIYSSPTQVRSSLWTGRLEGLGVDDRWNYAYIIERNPAQGGQLFRTIDLTNSDVPGIARTIQMQLADEVEQPAQRLMGISEGYILAPRGSAGMPMIDVGSPIWCSLSSIYLPPYFARRVNYTGGVMAVADPFNAMSLIDVNRPEAPAAFSRSASSYMIEETAYRRGETAYDATVEAANRAYLATNKELTILDVTERFGPGRLGWLEGNYNSLAVRGETVYAASWNEGLKVIDARDPAKPRIVGALAAANAENVTLLGKYALMNGDGGIVVADVSNPVAPTVKTTIRLPERADIGRFAAAGNLIYAAGIYGFNVFDIEAPGGPRQRAGIPLPGVQMAWVALRGSLAYVAAYSLTGSPGQLFVFDIKNPDAPVKVDSTPLPFIPQGITAIGEYLYINGMGGEGIKVFKANNYPPDPVPPAVQVLSPSGPLTLAGGQAVDIHWKSDTGQAGSAVRLELRSESGYSAPLGVAWSPIGDAVKRVVLPQAPAGPGYRIRATSAWNESLWGESAQPFTIVKPVQVLSWGRPVAAGGTTIQVHWKASVPLAGRGVALELWNAQGKVASLGQDWDPAGEGTQPVFLPLLPERSDYRIRVISAFNPRLWDESGTITITGGPVRLPWAPTAEQTWKRRSVKTVWWQTNPAYAGRAVSIELWRGGSKVATLGKSWSPVGFSAARVNLPPSLAPGSDYRLRVASTFAPQWWAEYPASITIQ